MTQVEFTNRTQVEVSAKEYAAIEEVYMNSDLDKDAFCKMWVKMNKSRVEAAKEARLEAEIVTPAFEDGKFIGARVCVGGEDFIIAPKDYRDGKEMPWQEAMDALKADNLSTWNYRQICLTMAYRKEVDKVLVDNGGDSPDNWYWTCAEYSADYSFNYDGIYGELDHDTKCIAYSVRPVLALAKS